MGEYVSKGSVEGLVKSLDEILLPPVSATGDEGRGKSEDSVFPKLEVELSVASGDVLLFVRDVNIFSPLLVNAVEM